MSHDLNRREFLKVSGAAVVAGAAAATGTADAAAQATPAPPRFSVAPIPSVRIGFVGIGGQGSTHVQNLLKRTSLYPHKGKMAFQIPPYSGVISLKYPRTSLSSSQRGIMSQIQ